MPDRCLAIAHRQLASIAEYYLMMTLHLDRVAGGHLNKAAQDKMNAREFISCIAPAMRDAEHGNHELKAFTTVLSHLKLLASK